MQTTRIPNKIKIDSDHIAVTEIRTPIGDMTAAVTNEGLCFLAFSDRGKFDQQLATLQSRLKSKIEVRDHNYFLQLRHELKQYFEGNRQIFNIPILFTGTQFQNNAWHALLSIPYGQTRSYKEQAVAIGIPTAVRAVANSNGQNPICIVVPCHRVIGSDGSLTGYGAGISRKEWLLKHEIELHRKVGS